ncbi:MAG TPA: terminase TerL endonuclease subunit [Chryseosolibacter sp.]|nr:terminase TerL endonuclease subunit [Chryseosolibacter sp.]
MKLQAAEQFIKDVISGKTIACEFVKLACQRHINDLETGHKRGLFFDPIEAQRWIDFAHLFYAHKNKRFAGKKIVLSPHQQFEFWCQMGWRRKDGTRRFRSSYIEVARKDGKTTREAIKANGHLFLDGEIGAQVWFAATKKDQALIALNDAAKVSMATPIIDKYYEYTRLKDKILRIIKPSTGSFMSAIGRDSKTEDGHDPSWGVIDEMHEHPTMEAIHILKSGSGSREQPMFNIITTAGFDKNKPCYSVIRKNISDILNGVKEDDSYFGIIYTLDDPEKWEDEREWIKANPNLGRIVTLDALRDEYKSAKNEGGETEVNFKTKYLNIWTDAAKVWIPDAKWMTCASQPILTPGKKWYGGLDLASTEDFCSYVLFSEPDSEGVHDVLAWYWIPEESLRERQKKDKTVNYRRWIQEGLLFTTPGTATDYDYIDHFITKKHQEFNIVASAYDKWNAQMLVNKFNERGMKFMEFGQGIAAQSEPTKLLKRLVLNGKIRHGGHPVLRWNISNVTIRMDANENIMLDKAKSSEKIDGARAKVNAVGMYNNRALVQSGEIGIVWF